MTAFPRAFLFPDWRLALVWAGIALWLAFLTLMTFRAAERIAVVLSIAVLGALWAADCTRRMRSWPGGLLVPGYARTAFVTAIGIVMLAAVSPTILALLLTGIALLMFGVPDPVSYVVWYLTRLTLPYLGLACLMGVSVQFGLTYAHGRAANRTSFVALGFVAFATLASLGTLTVAGVQPSRFGSLDISHWVSQPAVQGLAWVAAVGVAVALRRRLALPPTARHGRAAGRTLYFQPLVSGPLSVLRGGTRTSFADAFLIGATVSLAALSFDIVPDPHVTRAYISTANAVSLAVFLVVFLGSLTPLGLLKGAGTWMATAWQLGTGESRHDLGRRFAFRVVAATFATLGLVLAIASVHAWFGGAEPSPTDHQEHLDETLLLYTAGFVAFTWACVTRRRRTGTRFSEASAVAVVCAAVLTVAFNGLSLQWAGRATLLALLAASALLAAYVGGRTISRMDFLPVAKD